MKVRTKTKIGYAVGNLGYGTVAQTVGGFIMFFGTSVLGISGTLVGIAISIAAFWDGISDPIIGYFSDRVKSRTFGKRLGFMFVATFGIAISNILLWVIPTDIPDAAKFVWLLISLLSLETFNTMFATPYVALGIDIAPDYNDQASLQGYRTVFFIVGMILPSLLMFALMPKGDGGQLQQMGYINIAYINSVLAVICGAICILGTLKIVQRDFDRREKVKSSGGFFKIFYNFFYTLKKRNYGAVIIGYSVALISAAFLTAVGLHLFTYAYHFSSRQIPLLMTALFVGAIVSQPVWVFMAKRTDKKPALNTALISVIIGIMLTAVTFIFRDFFQTNTLFWLVFPCIFICGFGTGALYSLPISMLADVISVECAETGEDKAATYSSYMTLSYNIANAFALLIIGILLDLIKFNAAEPVQALSVQSGLGAIVFLGCAVSLAVSMLMFSRYNIKRSTVLKSQLKNNKKAS